MSTYERSREVQVKDLPEGYKVTFHEIRGYDSPDRWYEVAFKGRKLGRSKGVGYGSAEECRQVALAHAAAREEQ